MTTRPVPVYESSFAVAFADFPLFVDQARKISHDTVLRTSGRARRSGVRWTHFPMSEWRDALAAMGIAVAADRARAANDVELLARQHPGGVLVIATVEVDPDATP